MKKVVLVGITITITSAPFFGCGIASADNEYVGQTYADATQAITQAGMSETIATVVGDQLPTSQCRVTGSRSATDIGSTGFSSGSRIMLDLNCNADVASPGNPGNSVASPEGRQAREAQEAQQQAESQQNVGDELLQSGDVPGQPAPIPGG
ncbi:hypothetical protein ORI20_00780 [Mycobacterium sp. CVI_P3]|uniref:PASTA domain-containing protein n=1 Tax=Mycobacterium pinniadriaticum TaxID=2994102 RepID=A0ABT3S769_9MYCO|nr:hypothetical protein [Mycobacterium pinniadriaticum]MCX2928788.1 hypothetical protein [Mycobacterium pinniadriaticum]MCX2935345.1 hypothetical protein [Mycobacterium pinniadriaticum]